MSTKLNQYQRRSLHFNESSVDKSISRSDNDPKDLEDESNYNNKEDIWQNNQTSKRKRVLNDIISNWMKESRNINKEKKSLSAWLKVDFVTFFIVFILPYKISLII